MSADTTMTNPPHAAASTSHIDPAIFTSLQSKIDEESLVRDELKSIVETLSKQGRVTQATLSRIHNTTTSSLADTVLKPCSDTISEQAQTIKKLSETASKYPFYKWNSVWQRETQALLSSIQLCEWLGDGKLITLEEVGEKLDGVSIFLLQPHGVC